MTDPRLNDSPAFATAEPELSVLIPFLRDNPAELLTVLDEEAPSLAGQAELILLDDGTNDPALTEALAAQIARLRLPVRLISLSENEGRAKGRNRLASQARGRSYLFLDSDMMPDTPDFLGGWLHLITTQNPAVAFGGFSLKHAPTEPVFAVHRAMALRSECLPCTVRNQQPEKYVYTSNLLVRRDAFQAETFDRDFTGWGWEDVEWAMRIARRFDVIHVDNPATHMGLDRTEDLIRKYEQSVDNFARVVARHPQIVSTYPSYKVAKLLRSLPGRKAWTPAIKSAALNPALPVAARAFALRLYRAALYSEVVA